MSLHSLPDATCTDLFACRTGAAMRPLPRPVSNYHVGAFRSQPSGKHVHETANRLYPPPSCISDGERHPSVALRTDLGARLPRCRQVPRCDAKTRAPPRTPCGRQKEKFSQPTRPFPALGASIAHHIARTVQAPPLQPLHGCASCGFAVSSGSSDFSI